MVIKNLEALLPPTSESSNGLETKKGKVSVIFLACYFPR